MHFRNIKFLGWRLPLSYGLGIGNVGSWRVHYMGIPEIIFKFVLALELTISQLFETKLALSSYGAIPNKI